MDIGKKIRTRRQQLGLTLEQVGEECGVGKRTVRKWESGQIRNMRRDKLAALASVLKLDPVELIGAPEPVSDPDRERLEALHQNPRLGLLFDRTARMDEDAVEAMIRIAGEILKERDTESD